VQETQRSSTVGGGVSKLTGINPKGGSTETILGTLSSSKKTNKTIMETREKGNVGGGFKKMGGPGGKHLERARKNGDVWRCRGMVRDHFYQQ